MYKNSAVCKNTFFLLLSLTPYTIWMGGSTILSLQIIRKSWNIHTFTDKFLLKRWQALPSYSRHLIATQCYMINKNIFLAFDGYFNETTNNWIVSLLHGFVLNFSWSQLCQILLWFSWSYYNQFWHVFQTTFKALYMIKI